MKHHYHWPIIALIITNLIWGAAPPIFKFALTNVPPFTLGFIRFAVAVIIIAPFALRRWKAIGMKDLVMVFLTAFFTLFINIVFLFLGLREGESISASIIYTSGPVFIFFGAVLFLREKMHKKVLMGMLIAAAGATLIVIMPLLHDAGAEGLVGFGANIFFALSTLGTVLGTLTGKRVLERVDPLQFTFIAFFFSAILFTPFAVPEWASFSISDLNIAGWTGIIFGTLLSSIVAYGLYFYGMAHIDAQEVGVFTYVDPLVAIAIAIPLLGEVVTLEYALGSCMILAGIFIAEGRLHWHPLRRIRRAKKEA